MRLQQQTFLDKYIEKIILAVAVLISLAIVWFYVLGTPYHLEVSAGKTATPAEVENEYLKRAEALADAVKNKKLPEDIAALSVPDYKSRFSARYAQDLIKSNSFHTIAFGAPGVQEVISEKEIFNNLAQVKPPAPSKIAVNASNHVLASDAELAAFYGETALNQNLSSTKVPEWVKEATAIAGQREPRDFWSVSVSGVIDTQAWIDAYAAIPEERRPPASWYEDRAKYVADIRLERQVLDPATGKWLDDKVVAPLPGAVASIINESIKLVQADKDKAEDAKTDDDVTQSEQNQLRLFQDLLTYSNLIAKPQFLPVKPHTEWFEPGQEMSELSSEDQKLLMKLNQQIHKFESDLITLKNRSAPPTTGVTDPGRNPYDDIPSVRPPRGTPQPPAPPKVQPRPKQPQPGTDPAAKKGTEAEERIKFYETRLADLYKQKYDLLAKLNKDDTLDPNNPGNPDNPGNPGVDPRPRIRPPTDNRGQFLPEYGGQPLPGQRRQPGFPGAFPGRAGPGEFDGKLPPITFYVHDPTVQPGKTYQYRVVYRMINPLFNKQDQLVAEQKKLADKLIVDSLPSEWTKPVTIEAPLRYFVEDVNPSTASVTWGVYRIHNGHRIHQQFPTRPGDPIGSSVEIDVADDQGVVSKSTIDMSVPAVLLDLKTASRGAGGIGRGPISVLIADLADGSVMMRDSAADLNDADRIRLFNEATNAKDRPAAGLPGGPGNPGGAFPPEFIRPPVAPPQR